MTELYWPSLPVAARKTGMTHLQLAAGIQGAGEEGGGKGVQNRVGETQGRAE